MRAANQWIEKLANLRNQVAHSASPALPRNIFTQLWAELKQVVEGLGADVGLLEQLKDEHLVRIISVH